MRYMGSPMLRYTFELDESAAAAAADVRGAALAVASSAESVSEMNSSFIMCVCACVCVFCLAQYFLSTIAPDSPPTPVYIPQSTECLVHTPPFCHPLNTRIPSKN